MGIEDVALGMTCLCVRNTVIENYHAEGKISDAEMKAFNKEVANKIYTALLAMASSEPERRFAVNHLFETGRPHNWDVPEIDQGMAKAIDRIVGELASARSKSDGKLRPK